MCVCSPEKPSASCSRAANITHILLLYQERTMTSEPGKARLGACAAVLTWFRGALLPPTGQKAAATLPHRGQSLFHRKWMDRNIRCVRRMYYLAKNLAPKFQEFKCHTNARDSAYLSLAKIGYCTVSLCPIHPHFSYTDFISLIKDVQKSVLTNTLYPAQSNRNNILNIFDKSTKLRTIFFKYPVLQETKEIHLKIMNNFQVEIWSWEPHLCFL